ncbi:MAG: ThuA domain-containing protein [Verrucomicrobiota bacterium]
MKSLKVLSRISALVALCTLQMNVWGQNNPWLHFEGQGGPGKGKHIVLISGDEEYRSEETNPMLAKILSQRHGFDCTVLFSQDPENNYIDPNNQQSMPGLEALKEADLVIIGTRFRRLNDEQYQIIADYLNSGKPIMGFRTATHAFTGPGQTGDFRWGQFGLKILGETWISHHGHHKGQGTLAIVEEKNAKHPVLKGVGKIFGPTDVYGIRNLDPAQSTILLRGAVTASLDEDSAPIDGEKNDPMMPLAWLRTYTAPNGTSQGHAFCTTLGASVDMLDKDLRRLFVNVAYHLTGLKVRKAADVTFVDDFAPTFYGFNNEEGYYKKRNLKISDFELGSNASTGLANPKSAPAWRPVLPY